MWPDVLVFLFTVARDAIVPRLHAMAEAAMDFFDRRFYRRLSRHHHPMDICRMRLQAREIAVLKQHIAELKAYIAQVVELCQCPVRLDHMQSPVVLTCGHALDATAHDAIVDRFIWGKDPEKWYRCPVCKQFVVRDRSFIVKNLCEITAKFVGSGCLDRLPHPSYLVKE